MNEAADLLALAQKHGLNIDPESLKVNDMGLDYRVVIGSDYGGEEWVLRVPRREGLADGAAIEARVLELVSPHLSFAVPDWRIHSPELIAYPMLPGKPGLTLDENGNPVFHVDMASVEYARDMGDLFYELHSIDTRRAAEIGIPVRSPREVRENWQSTIDRVSQEFSISGFLMDRWNAWLADDELWPDFSVLTHGEIYAAHTLVEGNRITAVLDWTTSEVSDPVRDFSLFHASAAPEAFDVMLDRYREHGGTVWSRIREHCAEYMAASPLGYALYAIETGDPQQREIAQAGLSTAC